MQITLKILLLMVIVSGIIGGMSILLGQINTKTDTSNNILFYESIENENIKYDIDGYINKAKIGFCILLCLILFIFFSLEIFLFTKDIVFCSMFLSLL